MLENKDQNKTSLAQLGEFGLIDHITKNFNFHQKSTLKGIGDDAAVLDFKSKKTVLITDLLFEVVNLDLSYMRLKHLGFRLFVLNFRVVLLMIALLTRFTFFI